MGGFEVTTSKIFEVASYTLLSMMGTEMVLDVSFGWKVRVPDVVT